MLACRVFLGKHLLKIMIFYNRVICRYSESVVNRKIFLNFHFMFLKLNNVLVKSAAGKQL